MGHYSSGKLQRNPPAELRPERGGHRPEPPVVEPHRVPEVRARQARPVPGERNRVGPRTVGNLGPRLGRVDAIDVP